jgi:hypothetical protein
VNERIRELAEQAAGNFTENFQWDYLPEIDKDIFEKFAELVRADEREACAKACEEISDYAYALWKVDADPTELGWELGAEHCAQAIKARGEK